MAGIDQNQAGLIARTELDLALKQFAQASSLIQTDQQKILSRLTEILFKKPSIFKAGLWTDYIQQYPLALNGSAGAIWSTFNAGSNPTVFILNLQDADKVKISSIAQNLDNSVGLTSYIAYALSPFDSRQQIPCDQFSLVRTIRTGIAVTDGGISTQLNMDGSAITTGNIDPVSGAVNESTDYESVTIDVDIAPNQSSYIALQMEDEIPCAGNKYIHVFGFIAGGDLFDRLSDAQMLFSYQLIK